MRKQKFTLWLLSFAMCFAFQQMQGQNVRYLDEVFPEVTVTKDTTYATNMSILPMVLGISTVPLPEELKMDVYEPSGDQETSRPLVIIAHAGNYFPPVLNRSPFGSRTDSVSVEICTRLAKRGYVAVSMSYRLGWNIIAPQVEEKRKSLLQAAYRSIQDMRACVRYFRWNADQAGNGFGVNPDWIIVGGIGGGGYVSYGTAFLNAYDELFLPKFTDYTDPQNPVPYIDTTLLGDLNGVKQAPLNIPNYPGYSSDVLMGFALAGAAADTSWIDSLEVPFASLHAIEDPADPFWVGDIYEPSSGFVVLAGASGGGASLRRINRLGLNDLWKNYPGWNDPFTTRANQVNWGYEGLFPLNVPFTPCSVQCVTSIPGFPMDTCTKSEAPWHWFNEDWYKMAWGTINVQDITGDEALCQAKLRFPNDPARARAYIDTVMGFLTPRFKTAIPLANAIDEPSMLPSIHMYPNPAEEILYFRIDDGSPMWEVQVSDLSGRIVLKKNAMKTSESQLRLSGISPGLYLVQVKVKEGRITKKLLIK